MRRRMGEARLHHTVSKTSMFRPRMKSTAQVQGMSQKKARRRAVRWNRGALSTEQQQTTT
ncbi:hypothetical protein DPMN_095549 [Dreissena polymorpha]|uniref:Uncharacterized protein n=1 Tax=Dreissena polymorpha TaxID=45954 RepID=A0A9D4L7L3_DREPO|nr:hypothetical protein DPMN_095549 [Dreissena polymorpha]